MEIMTANCWTAISLQLLVILLGMRLCWAAPKDDTGQAGQDMYGSYNQEEKYNQPDYYSNYENVPEPETLCYVCHYLVKNGEAIGHDNCRDPFHSSGIPTLMCKDSCSKVYHKLSEKDYTIERHCTPNCVAASSDDHYVECCNSRLCNGAQASQARNHVTAHLVSIATAICLVLIFQLR